MTRDDWVTLLFLASVVAFAGYLAGATIKAGARIATCWHATDGWACMMVAR